MLETVQLVLGLPEPATVAGLARGSPPVDVLVDGASRGWFGDNLVARFAGVNTYGGVTWFDRDGFDRLVRWAFLLAAVELRSQLPDDRAFRSAVGRAGVLAERLAEASAGSDYQVERLLLATATGAGRAEPG